MEIINSSVLKLLYEHRYIFAFLGALFEGTFIMILSGVLFKFGYFNFWGLLCVLISGYLFNGFFWYLIGFIGGSQLVEKRIKRFSLGRKIMGKMESYFRRHSIKTLFLTRITYGFSMLSFIIAGSLKMNFKKFLSISLISAVFWVFLAGGIGYGFGAGFQSLSKITKGITIGLIILGIVLMVLFLLSFVSWMRYFVRTKFIQDLENHDSPFLSKIGELVRKSFHNKRNEG